MKLTRFSFLLLLFPLFLVGQNRPLDTWKMFFSYAHPIQVVDGGDRVYCANKQALYSVNKSDYSMQILDKITALSDVGIKRINYSKDKDVLVITYTNSNIDLIYGGTTVYNLPDLKNKIVTGSKELFDVSFGGKYAYLSSAIGIIAIDLDQKQFAETYIIGSNGSSVQINGVCSDGHKLYAATAEGVKSAPLSGVNLLDYNNWHLYDTTEHLPSGEASFINSYNGNIYTVISDTLFVFDGTYWSKLAYDSCTNFKSLDVVNNLLYFAEFINCNGGQSGRLGKIDGAGTLSYLTYNGNQRPLQGFEDGYSAWYADAYHGLKKVTGTNVQTFFPDGPTSNTVFRFDVKDNIVTVAPGGVNTGWGYSQNYDGYFVYQNDHWTNHTNYNTPFTPDFINIDAIYLDEGANKLYAGSYWAGLMEYDLTANTAKFYDQYNSILQGCNGDLSRTRISAITADANGNIWFCNAGATKPLCVRRADGTLQSFDGANSCVFSKIIVDQSGQVWSASPYNTIGLQTGIFVYSTDTTLTTRSILLTTGAGNGNLPNNGVNCIVEDKDGNIWAGTGTGIATFFCASSVLTSNGCDAEWIKVTRDGFVQYLFASEVVRAIEVDGANRKWVGSNNGVWLISADGKTELLHFTTENSPLPSNLIYDIKVNQKTGEVFFATDAGMVSYMGDAILGKDHNDSVLVYPNPVKPDYTGPIAIKGLVDNAYAKITDISGRLIFQGRANGGEMIWNGSDYNGHRAKSGIYLVFSATDNGSQKNVAKILVMN